MSRGISVSSGSGCSQTHMKNGHQRTRGATLDSHAVSYIDTEIQSSEISFPLNTGANHILYGHILQRKCHIIYLTNTQLPSDQSRELEHDSKTERKKKRKSREEDWQNNGTKAATLWIYYLCYFSNYSHCNIKIQKKRLLSENIPSLFFFFFFRTDSTPQIKEKYKQAEPDSP